MLLTERWCAFVTMQFSDNFIFEGKVFTLVSVSNGILFEPLAFGIRPCPAGTACYRGYVATYAIKHSGLVLDSLFVNLGDLGLQKKQLKDISKQRGGERGWFSKWLYWRYVDVLYFISKIFPLRPEPQTRGSGPRIGRVDPVQEGAYPFFDNLYRDVDFEIGYTGKILIGFGSSDRYAVYRYRHIGCFAMYDKVVELEFDSGHIKKVEDKSQQAKALREKLLQGTAEFKDDRPIWERSMDYPDL